MCVLLRQTQRDWGINETSPHQDCSKSWQCPKRYLHLQTQYKVTYHAETGARVAGRIPAFLARRSAPPAASARTAEADPFDAAQCSGVRISVTQMSFPGAVWGGEMRKTRASATTCLCYERSGWHHAAAALGYIPCAPRVQHSAAPACNQTQYRLSRSTDMFPISRCLTVWP